MRKRFQRRAGKSIPAPRSGKGRFEVVAGREVEVRMPLPLVEVWEELQADGERLTGEAGMQILRALLEDEVSQRLEELDWVALLIDGIEFAGQVLVVALGVAADGTKHVLGLWQGATENATVVKALLEDRGARGLDLDRRYRVVIDGSKALRAGIERVCGDRAEVQRCQFHKVENVVGHLPEGGRADWRQRMRNAYAMTDYAAAKAALEKLWRQLCEINPSAARRSLEEGMEETLTVHRLGVGSLLRRTLSTTNAIESCLSTVRHVTRNVKRWQGGDHVARWTAAGLLEAEKKFRRVQGYRELPELARKLDPGLHSQQQVA